MPAIFYLNDLSCSYLRCRFACDSAAFSNSRLLWILSDLQVPTKAALLRSPRLLALSAEGDYTAPALRFESGSGCKKQKQIVSHRPMAASEAMPPRRALPLLRHRTSSSCKLPMEFSLGGSKGGISLFEKEISLPCFVPTPRGAVGSALRCKNPILHTFCRPTNNNPASFIWKETVSIWKSERNSGVRCRL